MSNNTSKPHIFREYPELEEKIEWISLGTFPTPIEKLNNLGFDNLWIKRDDLTSDVYGGNKVRKLEFILANVLKKEKKRVVTMGGTGTNHGLATAIFCNKLGIDCSLLLFKQPVTSYVKRNLLLFKKNNADLVYKNTLFKTALAFYTTERIKHPSSYFLFAGGSTVEGTVGFVNAAFELKAQIDDGIMPEPGYIFCPLGSCGTLAGLSLGVKLAGLKSRIIGVRVTESHLHFIPASTEGCVLVLMKETYKYLRTRCRDIPELNLEKPEIIDDYFGEGYGCATEQCLEAFSIMKEKEKIKLDPTYTAKTFAAVLDHCKGGLDNVSPVLYWHTYNSVDLDAQAQSVDYRELPGTFRKIIEENIDI